MKIKFAFKGQYLGLPEPKKYDNGLSYSMSIMVEGEVGQLKCEEKVYEQVTDGYIHFGDNCIFNAIYNTDYKSCKIDRVKIDNKAV